MQVLSNVSSKGERRGRGKPRSSDDIRWAELTIYSTDDLYVVEVIRRSDVYHTFDTDCDAYRMFRVGVVARELDETDRPCYRCTPPAVDDLAPYDVVLTEVDRVEVVKVFTASEVVSTCSDLLGGGPGLTRLARRGLAIAGRDDTEILDAYEREKRRLRDVPDLVA